MSVFLFCIFFCNALFALNPTQRQLESVEVYKDLTAYLSGKTNFRKSIVTKPKLKKNTVNVKAYIATEMDLKKVPLIMDKFGEYPEWILEGINVVPGKSGKKYALLVNNPRMLIEKNGKPSTDRIRGDYHLKLPLGYQFKGHISFKLSSEKKTKYYLFKSALIREVPIKVISEMTTNMWFFSNPTDSEKIWIHIDSDVVFVNSLLCSLVPYSLFTRFIEERLPIVFSNYLDRQDELDS